MAQNKGWTALVKSGMASDMNGMKCMEAVVDVTKLTGGTLLQDAWIQLFYMPAGSAFLFGTFEVLTVDAGGGAIEIGTATSGTGAFHTQSALGTAVYARFGNTFVALADQSAAYVYLVATTAALTTLKCRVRMYFDMNKGAASQQ